MTKEILMMGIKKLRSAGFPGEQNFNDEKNEVWFEMLSDITVKDFFTAISEIVRTSKFFPTIAEIREKAISQDIMLATEAWTDVLGQMEKVCGTGNSPSFSTPLIESAVASLGGLDTIWQAGVDQEGYYRMNFIKAYDAMAKREHQDDILGLPTKDEASNILADFGLEVKNVN